MAAFAVLAWPPGDERSLAVKAVNGLADPAGSLPTLPGPLDLGLDDDADAVSVHDSQVAEYDRLYASSTMMRVRLRLKVATEPFNPATERQVLTAIGVLSALGLWQFGGRERR